MNQDNKNQKFKNLVEYLETVPTVSPTEDELRLMMEYDNDMEEQLRIQTLIKEKRK